MLDEDTRTRSCACTPKATAAVKSRAPLGSRATPCAASSAQEVAPCAAHARGTGGTWREQILELYAAMRGTSARARRAQRSRRRGLLSGLDRVLPSPRHRSPRTAGGHYLFNPVRDAARHQSHYAASPNRYGADRIARAVLLAHDLLPALSALHPLRVQGVPRRWHGLLQGVRRPLHGGQLQRGRRAGTGAMMIRRRRWRLRARYASCSSPTVWAMRTVRRGSRRRSIVSRPRS